MNNNAGIYIRLSQMDEYMKERFESESVENQRVILTDYAKEHNFNIIKEYVDDGYSGTNFDRPAFREMLKDLKDKIIDTIIVKDLSRFGRDHIQTGYFIETYFPSQNVRFISLLENLDSHLQSDYNDNVTFVMACNDYFSKQTSIKIRTSLEMRKKEGKFVGSQLPFGYIRDPEDKGHLIPNPETAPIVREMFQLASEGKFLVDIAKILNQKGYVTPSQYANHSGYKTKEWTSSSIRSILHNQVYAGDMVQSKVVKVSYKSEKTVSNPKSKWIIVENTHEPLVDKKTFFSLQTRHQSKLRTSNGRTKEILENYIHCYECANSIIFSAYNKRKGLYGICMNYSRYKYKRCTPHHIVYDSFEKQVFEELEKNKINTSKLNRKNISNIIDRIFVDSNKKVIIILKRKRNNKISFIYDSGKK